MGRNSSANGKKDTYMRLEAWTKGIQGRPPLAEVWYKRDRPAYDKTISPAERMRDTLARMEKESKKPSSQEVVRKYV